MRVCFIGHRTVIKSDELIGSLEQTIIDLIQKGDKTFFFGSKSQFNDLCWEIVTNLKTAYPFIKRVYVRSIYKNIDRTYEQYLLNFYEETYYPDKLENVGKYAYVERNYEMIDNSTYCVFYYNKNYISCLLFFF